MCLYVDVVCVVRISEWLHEDILKLLVVGNLVFHSFNNFLILSLFLSIGLRIIGDGRQMIDTWVSADSLEIFGYKLPAFVSQHMTSCHTPKHISGQLHHIVWHGAKRYDAVVQEYVLSTFVALVLDVGTALVGLEYVSVIMTTYWFLYVFLVRDPRKSMPTSSTVPYDVNDGSSRVWLYCLRC